jgi:hypothetical protein
MHIDAFATPDGPLLALIGWLSLWTSAARALT